MRTSRATAAICSYRPRYLWRCVVASILHLLPDHRITEAKTVALCARQSRLLKPFLEWTKATCTLRKVSAELISVLLSLSLSLACMFLFVCLFVCFKPLLPNWQRKQKAKMLHAYWGTRDRQVSERRRCRLDKRASTEAFSSLNDTFVISIPTIPTIRPVL